MRQALIAVLALTVLAQLAVEERLHFAVEGYFGFHALFGFLACAALILLARAIGALLKRAEDYYDEHG